MEASGRHSAIAPFATPVLCPVDGRVGGRRGNGGCSHDSHEFGLPAARSGRRSRSGPRDAVAKLTGRPQYVVDESVHEIFVSSAFVLLHSEKARKVRASRTMERGYAPVSRLKTATNRVFKLSFTVLPPTPICHNL
jgi:hypothetical protein